MVNATDHVASEKSHDFPRISNCAVYLRLWCQHCDVARSADVLGSQSRSQSRNYAMRQTSMARTGLGRRCCNACRPPRAPKPNCEAEREQLAHRGASFGHRTRPSRWKISGRNEGPEVVPSRCTKVRIVCGYTSDPQSGRCTKNDAWPWYSTFSARRRLLLA